MVFAVFVPLVRKGLLILPCDVRDVKCIFDVELAIL